MSEATCMTFRDAVASHELFAVAGGCSRVQSRALNAALLAVLALVAGCKTIPGSGSTPVMYRAPILETVAQVNAGLRNVPQGPDAAYTVLGDGGLLHFRLQGDVNVKVLIDGVELPRRTPSATDESGWQEPAARVLRSGSRNFFWDIAVMLPAAVRAPAVKSFQVTFAYDVVGDATQPTTEVKLRVKGADPSYDEATPAPSAVFVGNTENTKWENRMETAIVARGVTLAGWLTGSQFRNPNDPILQQASEDWHFDLYLDPDFIERNYGAASEREGPTVLVEPLRSALLPGNVSPADRATAPRIPLLSQDPAQQTHLPTASAFTLPGNGDFTAELNAWHTWPSARGPKPLNWVDDPDSARFPGNAWPFNPLQGVVAAPSLGDLAAGDYVIVSGTLWQDTAHAPLLPVDSTSKIRRCFEDRFKGHGGWLEIHPVDAVRRVEREDAPKPRKHAVGMAACNPHQPSFNTLLRHPEPPPSPAYSLRFQVVVDPRFTSTNATHSEEVLQGCEPPVLHVRADVPGPGGYSALYILWWEKTDVERPPGAICIPQAGPILGGEAN
jgi:hypothetical protein